MPREPATADRARADALAKIVWKRLRIKAKDVECPFENSFMTPCIVRDGSMCLVGSLSLGAICVGCEQTLDRIEAMAKGGPDAK
jgi:hypothetical protein